MKNIPTLLLDAQIDLRGCAYRESPHLAHIDGLLVYYHHDGQLVLSAHLTEREKLEGVQRLLSHLGHDSVDQPQLFFWTRDETHDANVTSPRQVAFTSRLDMAAGSLATDSGAQFFNPMPAGDAHAKSISLLQVPRAFLYQSIRTITDQPALRRAVPEAAHTFVEEELATGHYASLSLQTAPSSPWAILVHLTPPVHGQVRMTLGSATFGGRLADDGTSVLHGIEPKLLLSAEGPDLELWLEPEPAGSAEQA